MALLERAQIELIDITDAQPAVLTLAANLSRVQTEDSGVYSPDYSKDNNLIITPTLYVGKEPGKIDPKHITYTTNNEDFVGTKDENSYTYTINQNLVKINSVIITATISDDALEGAGATAQIELVKLSSSSNKYTAIISSEDDKTIFTPTDRADIKLTAALYLGDEQISSGISYQWYKNGKSIDDDAAAKESTYTVKVDAINSMSNYYCIITAGGNSYPTSSITIMDKTDPYSSQIISSNGLIFTSATNTTTLTCNVYQSNKLMEDNSNIIYKWYKNSISDESALIKTEATIEVTPQEENTSSVTYYCVASINGTETTSQITLVISPAFEAVVEPKQIFIPFTENEYNGENSYQLTFYLQFLNSIAQADSDSVSVVLNSVGIYFSYDNGPIKPNGENKYIITFTKNNEADFSQFPDSAICSINYAYRGVQQQQEFYFVKNVKGANGEDGKDGENGKDGNGIDHIDISYARSNDGTRPPDDNVEGGEINWYPSIDDIPEEKLKLQFLWEKKITHFTNGDQSEPEYSVSNNGREIEKIVEYYALGLYVNKTGVYVKEIKYNENGIRDSVILEDGQEKFIFDENGKLLLNENGDIIDASGVVFSSDNYSSAVFARLYPEVAEWLDKVPMGNSEIVIAGQPQDTIVSPEKTGIFIVASEQESSSTNNSLWLKYQMIYSNGSFGETEAIPLEEMNDLRLSAYRAETIYNDDSIQSIVGTREWKYSENGTIYEDFISYINQMPKEISMKVSHDEFSTYFTLKEEGVRIGKTNSNFTTLTDDRGFNIQYHPYGYNSENENLSSTTVGSFNARGLNTPEITLINNLEEQVSKNIIILKGTRSGGFLWTKGVRGGE